jgi:excisionase family DNA binding protein
MRYLVEARVTFEVQAESAAEAVRLVSTSDHKDEAVSVEYLVRPQDRPMALSEAKPSDSCGLDKAVYTVPEAAAIMRTSRTSVYEWVRRGITCIRVGRKVRIPRNTLIGILKGEINFKDSEQQIALPHNTKHIEPRFRKASRLPKTAKYAKSEQKPGEKLEEKRALTVAEAATMLKISVNRMRLLLEERKVYYYSIDARGELVPRVALDNFAKGLPPIATVEQNIESFRASGEWDDDLENAAAKLRAEWTLDSANSPTD